jgi:3-phosphoshikimate 1-carboxyvinyltransferase
MRAISVSYPGPVKTLRGSIELPASKSISNRLLVISALCEEPFLISNLSEAGDTKILAKALSALQIGDETQTVDVEDAGTAFRFLTALLACKKTGRYMLTGSKRMQQRPIGELVTALRTIGAEISYPENENYPPLLINGKSLQGGPVKISGHISSQFISALCLIAPSLSGGLEIELENELVSSSYISMTLQLMSAHGIHYNKLLNKITIPAQKYHSKPVSVENDWSSMSFLYAFAMLASHVELIAGLMQEESLQGDSLIRHFAADFGVISNFAGNVLQLSKKASVKNDHVRNYHLSEVPDMAIPVIVACAIRYPQITFSGLQHLKYKESDRLNALRTELQKVNIHLHYQNDLLRFDSSTYKADHRTVHFNCHQDHRIAMALSLFALEGFTVELDDRDCVHKSFPKFFEQLEKLGFICVSP